jgi:hypothetical protein
MAKPTATPMAAAKRQKPSFSTFAMRESDFRNRLILRKNHKKVNGVDIKKTRANF